MKAPSKSTDEDTVLAEWQSSRDLISTFDQRIHELRQWGFSFITALLAAQSLLLPSILGGGSNSSAITVSVKLGILVVTLVLIVALRQVEKTYQIYQKAANFRSLILERRLNIELGTTIADRHMRYHMSRRISAIYIAFVMADLWLGSFILNDLAYWLALVVAVEVATVLILRIGESDLHFARGERSDWTFDKLQYGKGEALIITLTNMSESDSIGFTKGDAICALRLCPEAVEATQKNGSDHGPPAFRLISTQTEVIIEPLHYYSWSWPTDGLQAGI
jgi:hypothetical protein